VLALAWVGAVSPAAADPIPGATYSGVAADGARLTLKVSSDGTIVTSYRITNVKTNSCQFTAEGDEGAWEGAPIVNNAFEYRYYDAILFRGSFPGVQSASGQFRLYNHASAATAACDTGTVSWTVTTAARPPSGSSGPGAPGRGTGPNATKHRFATRMAFRKLSRTRLGGRIISSTKACRAGRTVILWRGSRRVASTKSKADGSYSFARSAAVRGRRVRASSTARTIRAGICSAGSSTFIRA
jgi:hypothetical protein